MQLKCIPAENVLHSAVSSIAISDQQHGQQALQLSCVLTLSNCCYAQLFHFLSACNRGWEQVTSVSCLRLLETMCVNIHVI